ncbi:ATP-binding cassette domain-containing protein [Cryobacterium sp. PH29-G1]|uniref:ABC transporter ATP-binding protein/permease n=1 Tax=Cryobacterium sp. PH29-G1 TaxID=3046211 RepID=UPI0024BAF404|nr:ATP-binding cassette domain-containing protein [Cryobacterium sp. PH29-G1]MDJ0350244.1 ATP-binding cassette domain-containing protein [Cryobacterium sp. PH29-G1]
MMMLDRTLWQLTRAEPARLAGSTVLLVSATASYTVQAWFTAQALAALVDGRAADTVGFLAGIVATALVRLVLGQGHARSASALGMAVRRRLRAELVGAAINRRGLHDTADRTGIARLTLTDGVDGVEVYVSKYVGHLLQVLILCPVLLVAVASLNAPLAAVLAGCLSFAVLAPRLWDRLLKRRGVARWNGYEHLAADFLESLQGMKTLRLLGAVDRTRTRLNGRSDELHRATVATMRASLVDTALVDLAIQTGLVCAAAAAVLAATGVIPAPSAEVYLLLLLSSEVFRPLRELSRQWHAGYLGLSAVAGINALRAGAEPAPRPAASTGQPVNSVRFESVWFGYLPSAPVLRAVSFVLSPGQITALTGASGAGKSTVLDLILGFLTADSGSVSVGGYTPGTGLVSVVSQQSYLFSGTVRDNILSGNPGATDAAVQAAARAAGIHTEILALADGYDTLLAEAGQSLSGGQRQRVSVARALLADRPVLLLDEPTSALNDSLAHDLMHTLRAVAQTKVVLMIAHRTETLAFADRILHLQHGSLTEQSVAARAVAGA